MLTTVKNTRKLFGRATPTTGGSHVNLFLYIYSNTQIFYECSVTRQAMEAIWKIEDKLKLTTQDALLLVVCTVFAVIGVCTATVIKRKARQQRKQMEMVDQEDHQAGGCAGHGWWSWDRLRRLLMQTSGCTKDFPPPPPPPPPLPSPPLLGFETHGSSSPVWQRPILMGVKCEFPRFSGLILYDETGRSLDHSLLSLPKQNIHQEKPATVMRTTLKDLL